jgi:hypothetical protein
VGVACCGVAVCFLVGKCFLGGTQGYWVWGYAAGGKTLKEDSPQSTGGSISFANSINTLPIFLASCAEKYMVNRRLQGSIMMISAIDK